MENKSFSFYNLYSTTCPPGIYNLSPRDRRKAAFTLIEIMIVVSILGIVAAIVLPEFQNHTQQAKEAAAKDTLRVLRETIERYAAEHNDVPPGYGNNDSTRVPAGPIFSVQLTSGKYLRSIPKNPFNNLNVVQAYQNLLTLPANATGTKGWLYHPATRQIRLDYPGTDSQGVRYYDY
jgi:prepilin-type N-terminal cleavage/methylation domain-containing protein